MAMTLSKDSFIDSLFLLMKNESFDDISITSICKKAGLSRATFYRFFLDKNGVIEAFFERAYAKTDLDLRKESQPSERINDIAYAVFVTFSSIQEELNILFKQRLEIKLLEFLNKAFQEGLTKKYGELPPLLPYIYAGLIFDVALHWIKNGCKETPKEVAEMVMDTIGYNIPINGGENL